MKKIFAIVALAIASVCGVANAEDGLYVGGSLGFWHTHSGEKPNDHSTNQFQILPEIGYNLNETWAVGTTIGWDYSHRCNQKYSYNIFVFNPYARWTAFRTGKVQFFVDGTVGIGAGRASYKGDKGEHTAVTWNVGLRPGMAFNVNKHVSLVAHVGFLGYKGANNAALSAGKVREGGLMLDGNDLTLGFYWNF